MKFFYISVFIFSFLFLKILNFLLIKKNFSLDGNSNIEKHKKLVNLNLNVPASGGLYFIPVILFLNYENFIFLLISISLIVTGILSDIKILNSPKKRLLIQIILISIYLLFEKDLIIDFRIDFLNEILKIELLRVLTVLFFILVLINGYNFIDGVNTLSSLNILIVLFFTFLLINEHDYPNIVRDILSISIFLIVFLIFNFFGKNFLGDGGIYILSFITGIFLIKVSILDNSISPYYVANLLWYPAFENLFTILRRFFSNKKNYLPDNDHLHHLIFKYFKYKNYFKKNYLLSSFVGILINSILLISSYVGYIFYNSTKIQILLILNSIILYLIIFFLFKRKLK